MTRLYLASTSPRRRELLRAAGLRFGLLAPAPDPPAPAVCADPAALAVRHARHKALSACRPGLTGIVAGADTVVALGRRLLGKPAGPADARRMLRLLSGRTHRVITGLAVRSTPGGRTRTALDVTRVTFRPLGPDDIERYIRSGEPLDKAGAYGIQGRAGVFVTRVEGSYLNVVGLPVARLFELLGKFA
ncbi:MAG: Maf family protein [bacterium]